MQDIIDTLRNNGITKVPTIHNDKNPSGQYALKGLGKVDLYVFICPFISDPLSMLFTDTDGMGLSSPFIPKGLVNDLYRYPLGFDCDKPSQWNELSTREFNDVT